MLFVHVIIAFCIVASVECGLKYRGCYEATFLTRLTDSNNNTPEDCKNRCTTHILSGVRNGKECYCGHIVPHVSLKRPDKDCDMSKCPVGTNTCGGPKRMKISEKV